MKLGGSSSKPDAVGGKGGEHLLRHFDGADDMREVRLESHPPADRLDDRQDDLADGAVQLRDGLGGVVARIVAGELRRVACAPGDELLAVEQLRMRGDELHGRLAGPHEARVVGAEEVEVGPERDGLQLQVLERAGRAIEFLRGRVEEEGHLHPLEAGGGNGAWLSPADRQPNRLGASCPGGCCLSEVERRRAPPRRGRRQTLRGRLENAGVRL